MRGYNGTRFRKWPLMFDSVSHSQASPPEKSLPCVVWLGYGGLLPFVGLAVLEFADPLRAHFWSDALVRYGAVILSFVGALHWAFAMVSPHLDAAWRHRAFIWSVVPALLAWLATLLGNDWASMVLVFGFAAHLFQDTRLNGPAKLPAWYLPLRWRLTVVATLCLLGQIAT